MAKIGRNQPCPCGSGKKFKRCCGIRQDLETRQTIHYAAQARRRAIVDPLLQNRELRARVEAAPVDARRERERERELGDISRMIRSGMTDKNYSRDDLAELSGRTVAEIDALLRGDGNVEVDAFLAVGEALDLDLTLEKRLSLVDATTALADALAGYEVEDIVVQQVRAARTGDEFAAVARHFSFFVKEPSRRRRHRRVAARQQELYDSYRALTLGLGMVACLLDRNEPEEAAEIISKLVNVARSDNLTLR